MIPCLYCLTSWKDRLLNDKIFQHIVPLGMTRGIQFNPKSLTCDFELAAIQAFTALFPTATTHACFFHYSQALWNKITDLKLSRIVTSRRTKISPMVVQWHHCTRSYSAYSRRKRLD